ncbi:hypothetical protein FGG08_001402 [Glutinoglossum americanum]|uniref:G-patch domain-containing protein n=1 Tax=Glutinoglossum americanum TaxID=1670608 RepID=A0A9P8IBN9_9PEZI|nr:hypothetical protein FGG08_001402 [Glutinoglossum americanum]
MDGDSDDYMNMAIADPVEKRGKETYTQRRIRKQREAEIKGRTKSKAELRAEEAAAREAALSKSLDASNKGYKMMKMMGFQEGSALGKGDGRTEPLNIVVKEDRGGVGLDSEKKRKFREQVDQEAKRVKAEEGNYRDRVKKEREEKRTEGLVLGAQKVAEKLDTEADEAEDSKNTPTAAHSPARTPIIQPLTTRALTLHTLATYPPIILTPAKHKPSTAADDTSQSRVGSSRKVRPTKQINVLWRGLVRHREEKERERRMRYDLHQSLSRLPTYNDPTESEDDKQALGKNNALEVDIEEEDPELEEFDALGPAERLSRLVSYLREKYHYCFWCKYRYPDDTMDGCPGATEEDHD